MRFIISLAASFLVLVNAFTVEKSLNHFLFRRKEVSLCMSSSLNVHGNKFVQCLTLDELPRPGSAISSSAGDVRICIVVDPKGSIFALEDKIPLPVNRPLSSGIVHDDGTIEDPIAGTKFSLQTGEVVGVWCPSGIGKLIGGAFPPVSIQTYPIRHKGRSLEVQVNVESQNDDHNNLSTALYF